MKDPNRPKLKYKNVKRGGVIGIDAITAIKPTEIKALNKAVFNAVKVNMNRAREVLAGTRRWDAQQTRLYLALLDKVMPSLRHTVEDKNITHNLDDMTVEELMQMAAAAKESVKLEEAIENDTSHIPPAVQALGEIKPVFFVEELTPDPSKVHTSGADPV